MDPEVALARIRELVKAVRRDVDDGIVVNDRAVELAEVIDGLDGWLSWGGFLPRPWAR